MNKHQIRMGSAVADLIDALETYCCAYYEFQGGPVGNDCIIGDEGVRDILHGINTLLNGDLGQHDGGNLSARLHQIAHEHELADENGEF